MLTVYLPVILSVFASDVLTLCVHVRDTVHYY